MKRMKMEELYERMRNESTPKAECDHSGYYEEERSGITKMACHGCDKVSFKGKALNGMEYREDTYNDLELEINKANEAYMNKAFKPGDLVRLKSGGPIMTVEAYEDAEYKIVSCVFYDHFTRLDNGNIQYFGQVRDETFFAEVLEKVNHGA